MIESKCANVFISVQLSITVHLSYCECHVVVYLIQTHRQDHRGMKMIMCLLRNLAGICQLLLSAVTVIRQIPEGDLYQEIQFGGHRLDGKHTMQTL